MRSRILLSFFGAIVLASPLFGGSQAWTFSNGSEFKGATGTLKKVGDNFQLKGDFTKGGSYVAMVRHNELPSELLLLVFDANTAASQVAVRFTGSDGQIHQHFLPLSGREKETQTVIARAAGSPEHHWGGKNDGILYLPVKAIQIITHRGDYSDNRTANLSVGNIRFFTAAAVEHGVFFRNEMLNDELPNWHAGGSGSNRISLAAPNTIRLETDFSEVTGGQFITLNRALTTPMNLSGVRFKMRGNVTGFDVRFVDAGFQIHQFYLKPAPDGKWQEFSVPAVASDRHWNGANDGVLRQPIRTISFGIHNWQQEEKTAMLEFSDIQFTTPDYMAATIPAFEAPKPETMFRRPDDEAPIVLQLRNTPEFAADIAFHYLYTDYRGNFLSAGTGVFDAANRTLSAPPPPSKQGFVELNYPALGIQAGIMIDGSAIEKSDAFFAIDSSFSWGAQLGTEKKMRSYLRLLKQNGILWNRDRIAWGKVAPAPDKFDFGARFGLYRRLAEEEGILTLDVFHDTPAWLEPKVKPEVYGPIDYPTKLKAAGENWANIIDHWSGTLKALEVWNEPDLKTYPFPDQISSFTKAISRILSEKKSDTVVVGGVFAHPWPGTAMQDAYLMNGMLETVDVMSYHTYAGVSSMEPTIGGLRERELALKHPRAGIPIWITECGTPWTLGGDRAIRSQDIFSAAEIVGKAFEFKALGVERYFAFEYKYYQEGLKNFGMMDANHTPMRSMAAYTHAAKVLGNKEYIGDLPGTVATRARIFSDGTDAVVAIYVPTWEKKKHSLTLPRQITFRATGIDGRTLPIRNGKVDCADGVIYLHQKEAALRPLLRTNTLAMKYHQLARDFKREPRMTPPVVFRSHLDVSQMTYDAFGYNLRQYEDAKFTVGLTNLSAEPQKVRPALELPEGTRILEAPDQEYTLAPDETIEYSFRVEFDPMVKRGQWRQLRLVDRNRNALPLSFSIRPWKMDTAPVQAATPESEKLDLTTLLSAKDWIDFSAGENWRSWQGGEIEPNIEARFRAFYTADTLQIQVLVKDESFHQPYAAVEAWRGDSLQLAFQQRGANGLPPQKRYWNEITAAKTGNTCTIYGHRGNPVGLYKASRLRFLPLKNNYWLYVLDLDAKEAQLTLSPGAKIGFTLLVDSNSGKGRDGFLAWGDGIAGNKDHSVFNCLELK